ncbi:kinase-like protein [Phanerochaete sordida]|uniref:Kinase-like protein n=1 Tax=Phanerochaete sordida TaxID=48140 RepID=A0A9P3GJF2_9APHY|nr:kinase-like protein [Phanerochaete sordida]
MYLPIREMIKTEAEVAAMDCLRARTTIPVPRVHLFCSSNNNPVRAEWMVMDLVDGELFSPGLGKLTVEQQKTTAADMARIMEQMYSLTATQCGSMLFDCSLRDDQRAVRYTGHADGTDRAPQAPSYRTARVEGPSGTFILGPVNEPIFLDYDEPISAASSGPFATEREYLEAIAYLGIPATRRASKGQRWSYERTFEIYDAVRTSIYHNLDPVAGAPIFYFAHNDFSSRNILLDPATGHITGVIDWEMAGFVAGWYAAAPGGSFDDDYRRFIFDDWMDAPLGYADERPDAALVREHFREELKRLNPRLFDNYWRGVELRAIRANLGVTYPTNLMLWLGKYAKYHWKVTARGPLPFDMKTWIDDMYTEWRSESKTEAKATTDL